jgi:OPA family sugar phosphate sensor protein UhpC-like MFS transporter
MIGSAFLYTYAFGKLTNGFLADHVNVRTFFATGLLVSALLNLILGAGVEMLWLWVILWGLNGWFSGFLAPASAVSLSNWFSNRERGRFYGIWSTAHAIGEGLSFYGTAALVGLLGWRAGFWGPGVLCVVSSLILYRVLLERPQTVGLPPVADWKQDHGVAVGEEKGGKQSTWKLQSLILRSPAIWVIVISNALMYVSRYAINSWGILYLQEARGYGLAQASLFMTVNTVAGIVGSIAYGFVSDKLFAARRPPANLIFGAAELAALFVIFFVPPGHPVILGTAFAVYGFSLSGILASLGGLFAMDIAPKKAAGAAMGFSGVFGYLGAAIQDQVSGYLIHRGTTHVEGIRHYDFSTPIVFWIGASALSLILAATLWRVKPSD